MVDLSFTFIVAVFATFFVAGLVKGVTGMGLPTVAMGVLGAIMSPLVAASLLIMPSMVTNIWQLSSGPSLGSLLRRLWPMMLGIVVGTVVGSRLIASGGTQTTTTVLGCALVIYAVYTLLARPVQISHKLERRLSPLIGTVTGVVTGGTGIFVIPAVPYLQALGLSRDDLVQALGMSFTVSTVALAIGLGAHGALRFEGLAVSGLTIIPALGGMWAGQILRRRISPATFRRWFLICLTLLGFEMISRALM